MFGAYPSVLKSAIMRVRSSPLFFSRISVSGRMLGGNFPVFENKAPLNVQGGSNMTGTICV